MAQAPGPQNPGRPGLSPRGTISSSTDFSLRSRYWAGAAGPAGVAVPWTRTVASSRRFDPRPGARFIVRAAGSPLPRRRQATVPWHPPSAFVAFSQNPSPCRSSPSAMSTTLGLPTPRSSDTRGIRAQGVRASPAYPIVRGRPYFVVRVRSGTRHLQVRRRLDAHRLLTADHILALAVTGAGTGRRWSTPNFDPAGPVGTLGILRGTFERRWRPGAAWATRCPRESWPAHRLAVAAGHLAPAACATLRKPG